MAEEKRKIFVSEVFWNVNDILSHHKRMLRSLFARQRDQHPLIQSVADIILDSTFVLGNMLSPLTPLNIRRTPVHARV